ncbi:MULTISPECIES: MarR family winged helix-turn-helix transcriptional regulator [Nostocales]|uniref:Transcriptional regulator n=3 Tax=Nostocales TaxID=1161 RepID=A0A0C1N8H7_9CYAN|nr:MarR family transcriptional regulator [Tolypothrix bouteillei]KAF3886998.1 MarR family transcriptional regulator [Tolypothrix bouteillei VB521301]
MAEKPTQETLCYLIVQVCKAHRNEACKVLSDMGLHIGQEILLIHLWENDGLIQSDLAFKMQVEAPTLTKMLNRMEIVGLLQRRRDEEDARICRIYLTDAGRALQKPVQTAWNLLEERILANLTLEEQLLLRRLLLQVHNNLS